MNFRVIIVVFFSLFLTNCFSQGETNFWYFGFNAGLDFNSGSPIVINDGKLYTEEGATVISSPFGELIFYTDGVTVYDKNHAIMPNGTGLGGHSSSTQSALVIPKPGSSTIYYLFTTANLSGPLTYSEIDLSLNGGLGEVTLKNAPLLGTSAEKITAVRDGQGGFWVCAHGFSGMFDTTGENFYSFSVTADGVDTTPVVSTVGATVGGLLQRAIGYMKFSPDGKYLVSASNRLMTEIFNFDKATGIISNPKTISTKQGAYGVEFSPSGRVLYLTVGEGDPTQLYQYDMTATDIAATGQMIYDNPGQLLYALQLASDFKIYMAVKGTPYLNVINNPEVLGTGCNFMENVVNVSPGMVMMGLPQFIQSYFFGAIDVKNMCFGTATEFELLSDIEIQTILWDFGDGTTSTDVTPSHLYASPGTYTVTVTATSVDGNVSKRRDITILTPPVIATAIGNQKVCEPIGNNSIDLSQFTPTLMGGQSTTDYGVSYFASLASAQLHFSTLSSNLTLHSGQNKVFAKVYHLQDNTCSVITDFNIELYEQAVANSAENLFVCDDITNDGKGIFALLSNNPKVLKFQNKNVFKVSYHRNQSDADTGNDPLPKNYANETNPQNIYVRVQNDNFPGCYDTTMFTIEVNRKPVANPAPTMYECDDDANDGKTEFDLSLQDVSILGSQPATDFEISYHLNAADANSHSNPLPYNYVSVGSVQTIYARITSRKNESCYDITAFQIVVKDKPVLVMEDIYGLCDGKPSVAIDAPAGFDSYLWSNGDTTSSTQISTLGNHSLTVTIDHGDIVCSTTKNFLVQRSNPAVIKDIKIVDWDSSYSSITIMVTGDGLYEYSLDGKNYQDSNQFTGLEGGEYTVFVRDKFDCGEVDKEVVVLVYPKYFTPNGDGINDTWSIRFALIYEPNMQVQIFDRYGKILKTFTGSQTGWDGKLNGSELPATDYWFVVTRQDGRVFKGHFSLVR